jgi:hypothetical protein
MLNSKIKIRNLLENQLPAFLREDNPEFLQFLNEYFKSTEVIGGPIDILNNIDQYVKLDNISEIIYYTTSTESVSFFDDTLSVESTEGFPDNYGLIQINDEIIFYETRTDTSFVNCSRGFSGITSYRDTVQDSLIFSESSIQEHISGSDVYNLGNLFLRELYKKFKLQYAPGFDGIDFYEDINEKILVSKLKDFYASKGAEESFKILFKSLYNTEVSVVRPRDFVIQASDADYRITRDLVVEAIEGNPEDLINLTLFQDATDTIEKASGTITKVENLYRNNNTYYQISLDYNPDLEVFNFTVHPKTKLLSKSEVGQTYLTVDSTLGFPESGILNTTFEGVTYLFNYSSKSSTQFFGCTNLFELPIGTNLTTPDYAYGTNSNGNIVKVRVTGVLSELNYPDDTARYSANDEVDIISLGIDGYGVKNNDWFFNIAPQYEVKEIIQLTTKINGAARFRITTIDENIFSLGNIGTIKSSTGLTYDFFVISVADLYTFDINLTFDIDLNAKYYILKGINQANCINYPEVNIISTDVQNVYIDKDDLYVTSASLPTYLNTQLDIKDFKFSFTGSFSGNTLNVGSNSFYTGDAIYYESQGPENKLNIPDGLYFIKKESDDEIKLSTSRSNIFNSIFLDVYGDVVDNKFYLYNFYGKSIKSQELVRKIGNPKDDGTLYPNVSGSVGIFKNGVEILSYRSNDTIYYGKMKSINVSSGGNGDYDVINPPVIYIEDAVGSGATGVCHVKGSLSRIDLIDSGFDFIEEPKISIFGGNGEGAKAKCNMSSIFQISKFNSGSDYDFINLTNNTIGFSTYHRFRQLEKVIYLTEDQTPIGNLVDKSVYYLKVIDPITVKVHNNYNDAFVGINTINLTTNGSGLHKFQSFTKKQIISSIEILSPGKNYTNKKLFFKPSDINEYSNIIKIENHGYLDKEIVYYNSSDSPISGLTSTNPYYVKVLDENNIRLSFVGIGTTVPKDYYFNNRNYIDFKSVGSGIHELNYEPITVKIEGPIGITTVSGQDFAPKIQPIFRGFIESVSLSNNGANYGTPDILNYNRQPLITLKNGVGAVLIPIVSSTGSIIDILITNRGSYYNSPPKLEISGDGSGAILTPIIKNGFLTSVKIVNGGSGYNSNNAKIEVIPAGSEAKFEADITSWTINLVEKLINSNQISVDDGVVRNSINANYELQYCHAYAPTKLREKSLSSALGQDGELIYRSEILNDDLSPKYHSAILGWAYDGNPIYGPYGYSNGEGGEVRMMVSGYQYIPNPLRPNNFPSGFFVEDYVFVGDGDLDIHNGRYCITPEFPNGIYAYFCTLSKTKETSGPFRNKLKPVFPYVIGNYYKSKIIDFNYNYNSNQNDIDLNSTGWFRNTHPYGLIKNNTTYNGVVQPDKFKQKYSLISSVSRGSVDKLNIISPGNNYKVGDQIFFRDTNSGGSGAYANITEIFGKNSTNIEYTYKKINAVELINYKGVSSFIGITTSPHNFENGDVVSVQNLNIFGTQLNDNFSIGISTNKLKLSNYVPNSSITGIITYINVVGNLTYPLIMVNDILGIGTEQVRVLEIDNNQFRLKVRRGENSTIGLAHSEGIDVTELPRKFYFNVGYTTSIKYELNREFYFNPKDTLGIGSVGIGTTITFSNPGTAATQIFVPYKSILFPNHKLNTGDELVYNNNGNGSIKVSTATSSYNLPNKTKLYVAKISNDLVGISTVNIGIGTNGTVVGIDTTAELLTFVNYGSGIDHSFVIKSKNNLIADIYKKSAKVTTSPNDHGLSVGDKISIDVFSGIQTTFTVQYNEVNRRLVINPINFTALDVDVDTNTISLPNHGYISGQKIIHTSGSPSGGLDDQGVYYVIVVDENKIKLSTDYYSTINLISDLNIINITSASFGALSAINPELESIKYSVVSFDLSDPSLSSNGKPAFNFDLYTDSNFRTKYFGNLLKDGSFNVTKNGIIGIDDNAKLTLKLDENTPQLYYNLEPINSPENSTAKIEIIEDDFNILNNNKLTIINSRYAQNSVVTGVTTNTFTYPLYSTPEKFSYSYEESEITYSTTSKSASGPANKISIESKGRLYQKLPSILKTSSGIGTNALFLPNTQSIGKIQEVRINEIGFDYPVDLTLSPSASLPQTYKIEPLSKFKSIKIVSPGINYFIAPKLVVIDGFTGRVNSEVDLRYNLGDTEVTIVRNSTGFYNVLPIILPTSNPNGSRISEITYDIETNDVVVGLAVSYSSPELFPFSIGEKIIIENTNVTPDTDGENPYGYNSSNYEYKLFVVKDINPNVGELTPTITFNLNGYLPSGRTPGNFDSFESFGSVTPEKYFPTFAINLDKGTFYSGEEVSIAGYKKGIVQNYDIRNEYLKVRTKDRIEINDLVVGKTSGNKGIISIILKHDSSYKINSNSITKKGWQKTTGYTNDNLQRIHDNDYYQYFSYAIRSPIEYNTWNPIVKGLTHTSGFKKFGEMIVNSYDQTIAGIPTDQNLGLNFSVADIIDTVDLNSVKDFDIAKEKSILVDKNYVSNEILFTLPFLQKFQEFIGNRVLPVDDISEQFNNSNLSFNLYSNNYPIFKIDFEGNNSSKVDVNDHLIDLHNHYFVSGEQIQYIPPNNNFANAIGIGTTTIVGIGITNKLPGLVYVIKIDNQKIQLASSPENALLFKPIPLLINSVGIGTTHTFKSINQNTRLLVTINNMIQSPVVSTAITSKLVSSVGIGSTTLICSGISSIFGGDLIQIDDEIIKIVSVGVGSTNSINVLRSWMGTTESSHSSNTLITKLTGNYNIIDNTVNFIEPIWGNTPVGYGTTAPTSDQVDYIGLTTSSGFSARVFLRSSLNQAFTTSYVKAYDTNYIFDDISQGFNGITTQFALKQNKSNIAGISQANAIILINDVFQGPQRLGNSLTDIIGDYKITENSGISTLNFTGTTPNFNNTHDINVSNVPRGGILVSLGSTSGLGYQPLVSAGGTAIVSVAGTIQSISIGNSGSGYRVGVQTNIKVGIQTYSLGTPNITYVGYASAINGNITNITITNPGVGYTSSNPPLVIIDPPLSYTNIPLIYSSASGSIGIGTGATVDIIVGQGSSVINFELKNGGYAYNTGDILTIPFGGTSGIPTDTLKPYKEFNIFVDRTYNAKFAGWSVGDFLVLDDISKYFNGRRRLFPLSRNGDRLSFYAKQSSGIDLQSNLLVFINDILQVPGESYTFSGGSILRFLDAPKGGIVGITTLGDKCKLFMYTGTQTIDVKEVQVLETIKIGDNVQLYSDYDETLTEEERLVIDINAADSILTNNYAGQGVVDNELLERPITWSRQLEDKIIDGIEVGKDRVYYEPNIHPSSYLIQSVGIGSTELFVNTIRPFFDDPIESLQDSEKNIIEIISQNSLIAAAATCKVSAVGTISEITVTNPGYGYTTNPIVTIQSPTLGSNNYAIGISSINNSGIVTSIQVSVGGTGYFYGPISTLSITEQGSGFPTITPSTNIFTKARLKTKSGYGVNATADIVINPNNFRVVSASIVDGGNNYKIGDQLFLDIFDNVGLADTTRRSALTDPIVFTVATIQPPIILIAPPVKKIESISNITYTGDYGIVVGVGTTNVGISTGVTFDFYIPQGSFLRSRYSIYKSGIQTGYYFTITNSSLGYGVTSVAGNNSILGIGSTCLDNIYEVISTNQIQKSINGVGITTVIRVTTKVSNYNGLVGVATTSYYGEYSWGKIDAPIRIVPVEYNIATNKFSGIGTNPIVRRKNPLKYFGYYV